VDVGGGVNGGEVLEGDFAEEVDAGGETEVGGLFFDGGAQGAATDEQEVASGAVLGEGGEGVQEQGVVFEGLEAGDVEDDKGVARNVEGFAEGAGLGFEVVGIHGVGDVLHVDVAAFAQAGDAGAAGDKGVGEGDAAAGVVVVGGGEAHDNGGGRAALFEPVDEVGKFADLNDVVTGGVAGDPAGGAPLEPFKFQLPHPPAAFDFVPGESPQPRGVQDARALQRQRRRGKQGRAAEVGDLDAGAGQMARDFEVEGFAAAAFEAGHSIDEEHPHGGVGLVGAGIHRVRRLFHSVEKMKRRKTFRPRERFLCVLGWF